MEGLGGRRHCRPDRDHGLDAHGVEFAHHAGRIGPSLGVEAPLALARPVEEVDDNAGERQVAALVLAGDGQKLVLRPVAQLALPEAGRPLGKAGAWPVAFA
jgi:hypothetical protein